MIYGPGVQLKYNTIVDGRRSELFAGLTPIQQAEKADELLSFIHMVRNEPCDLFEQWYQLYK